MRNRSELLADPRILRSWREIRVGDEIECWLPVMIPTDNWPPYVPDQSGEMHKAWVRVAVQKNEDSAKRWTDDYGNLVHTRHDGIFDVDVPDTTDIDEILLLVASHPADHSTCAKE